MAVQHPHAKEIFLEAVAIASSERRAAFLDGACAGDEGLRRRVEALIEAHERPETLLDGALVDGLGSTFAEETIPLGTFIGPYKLLEAIGEGGMGAVFMAEQTEPVRRRVALKIIKPGMDTKQVVARFEAERQALAMMDHPNIARVFDGGTTPMGRPYFVMELVRGIPITEYCDQQQLSIPERLELFVLVCRAVQHAHQKGVIHRDLKPSNVLVTVIDGVGVPKVIDFGVAKATGAALTEKTLFTGFHQFVGTPLYTSPEQAELSGGDVDTRSDIYSLGVLLYELLTGTTPFDQVTFRKAAFDEMRRIIREQEPPRPSMRLSSLGATRTIVSANRKADTRHLDRTVRGELDWIVMKALEKDRGRRYETANDFAADVLNHLAGRPVEASPPSRWYRFGKFARRNRAALTTTALISLTLVAGTAFSAWQAIRATQAERRTARALTLAQNQRRLAERHLHAARLRQAREALDRGEVERAQEVLATLRPAPGEPDLRGFAWHHLRSLARRDITLFEAHTFEGHQDDVFAMALSPGGRVLATGDEAGVIILWDVSTGQARARLTGKADLVATLAFSGDGRGLVSVAHPLGEGHPSETADHQALLWDTATRRRIHELNTPRGECLYLAMFSPSGRRLVAASETGRDGLIRLDLIDLSAKAGPPALVRSRLVERGRKISMAGPQVAAVPVDGSLTVYDAETLEARWSASGRDAGLGRPSLSATGERLVAVGEDEDGRHIVVLEAATGRELARARVGDQFRGELRAWVSPDGSKVLVASDPLRLALFQMAGAPTDPPRELSLVDPGRHRLRGAIFSKDGTRLVVITQHIGGGWGPVSIWDTRDGRLLGEYPGRPRDMTDALFTPDGRSLLLSGGTGVRRWRFAGPDGAPPDALAGHGDEAWALAFSPRGDVLATGGDDTDDPRTLKVWDPATGRLRLGWNGGPGTVSSLAFSPDGAVLASGHLDESGSVRLWEAATGRPLRVLSGHAGKVRSVAFSPDGRWLASVGDDAVVRLWDGSTARAVRALVGHDDKVRHVAFSPDSRSLASASNDRTVRLWEVATGHRTRVLKGPAQLAAVGFAPDGASLAAVDEAGSVLTWDARSGTLLHRLHNEDGASRCLAFAPDGRTLATSGAARAIQLWDPLTGQELLALNGHEAQVNALAFSPDGRTLTSCSHDGAVRLWRADTPGPETAPGHDED